MSDKSYKFLPKNLLVIFLIGAAAVIAVFGLYFSQFHSQFSNENSNWGTFGDFVGGTLNPLLSFLGLLALLLTVAMQRDELEKTHEVLDKQLAAQVEQLENAKKVSDEQLKTQAKQQFESTFFALLNMHNQVLSDLSYEPPAVQNQSSDIARSIMLNSINRPRSKLRNVYLAVFVRDDSYVPMNEKFFLLSECKRKIQKENNQCGHYFRILYQILKFIENNAPTGNEKMYSNIVRALLTDDVMQLLAVNCYCEDEKDTYWQYKLLVENYALFEHAPFHVKYDKYDEKIHPALLDAQKFYDKKAFGL
jgi:uncharacterized membrane protein